MEGAVRLAKFDVDRLREDLASIENEQWVHQHDYTIVDPDTWTAIALTSFDGSYGTNESLRYKKGDVAKPTPLLEMSPYFAQVIDFFDTNVLRARLMKLRSGTVIREHRDYGQQRYSFERKYIRVHIPIVTHEKVVWKLRGEPVPLKPGEAWYLNVCDRHAVENNSSVDRVHLVLDMEVNESVRKLFPPMSLKDKILFATLPVLEPPWRRFVFNVWRPAVSRIRKFLGDLGLRRIKNALFP